MQVIKNWENRSTIRTRPRRMLVADESKYFFPPSEQMLHLHPLVSGLGEKTKRHLLIHSAYMFMRNITLNETEVVCAISNKIIQGKVEILPPDQFGQPLVTVVIDENYHAYVANDFTQQVAFATGIKPIEMAHESSLSRALIIARDRLPLECRALFEIIAVCIAENSITQELLTISRDPEVNRFFYEVNADHIADEGRHCGIFLNLLTHLWREISEHNRATIGPVLPYFIFEYLKRDVRIYNERKILSQLALSPGEIEAILCETHPEYTAENLRLINPIVGNITAMLQKSGVLLHQQTAAAFKAQGMIL